MQDDKPERDLNKRPTRNDVAARAGVSTAVVSYVMNDGPRKVAPATRQRVLDAVKELGYRPNDIARSLRAQNTHMIGLIGSSLHRAEHSAIASGVGQAVADAAYLLTISNIDSDPNQGIRSARLLIAKRVDGIIIVPSETSQELLDLVVDERVPVVVAGEPTDGVTSIFVDPAASGELAVQHLTALGHSRIAMIRTDTTDLVSQHYFAGYKKALLSAGLTFVDRFVTDSEPSVEGGARAAARLVDLDRAPTAFVAQNDLIALGVVDLLQQRGLAIPRDISVVSTDDLDLGQHVTPQLTTVPTRGHEVGRLAAEVLFRKIGNEAVPMTTLVTPEPVLRESTGTAPR